jgi:hypothetical protein
MPVVLWKGGNLPVGRRQEQLMRNRACTCVLFVLLLAVGARSGVRAQQPGSAGQAAPPNGWAFEAAPYLWFPTVNLSLEYNLPPALGGRLPTDVSVGPGDVYGHFDFGGMFAAEARNGPFSLLTDFIGARFSATSLMIPLIFDDRIIAPSLVAILSAPTCSS